MNGRVIVCNWYRFCFIPRFLFWILELFLQYGIVPTVWNCFYSMELFLQYGIVPTVWHNSMELFLQYGIVPTVWNVYFSFSLIEIHHISDGRTGHIA